MHLGKTVFIVCCMTKFLDTCTCTNFNSIADVQSSRLIVDRLQFYCPKGGFSTAEAQIKMSKASVTDMTCSQVSRGYGLKESIPHILFKK